MPIAIMAIAQIMRKPWSLEEVSQLRKLVKQNGFSRASFSKDRPTRSNLNGESR